MKKQTDHKADTASKALLSDLVLIRERARAFIAQGAVTAGYDAELASMLQGVNAVFGGRGTPTMQRGHS